MANQKTKTNKDKARNQKFLLQRVERGLIDEVALMAPRFRRSTSEMLNAVLAFGLNKWKQGKWCEECLNTQERFEVKNG